MTHLLVAEAALESLLCTRQKKAEDDEQWAEAERLLAAAQAGA